MRPTELLRRSLLIGVALAAAAGCSDDKRCDHNQRLDNGVCFPVVADAAPAPDAEPQTGDAATGPTFGSPCHDPVNHSDCQGAEVSLCLQDQAHPMGQCSAVCDASKGADACPAGWTCFDLSLATGVAGRPYACLPNAWLGK